MPYVPDLTWSATADWFVPLSNGWGMNVGGGFRWVDLAPPDGGARIAVIASGTELPTGTDTGIRLVAPDAHVAHARLVELGLRVGELLDWPTAPLMFSFQDPDGNRFYVSEPE